METVVVVIGWALRAVGLLWLVGGLVTIRQVWRWRFLDEGLDQLETALARMEGAGGDEPVADPGRNRWLIAGGVLTSLAGLGLLLAHRAALAPLSLLVLHQVLYARRQGLRVAQAKSAVGKELAEVSTSARRAAVFSVMVWGLAGALWWG